MSYRNSAVDLHPGMGVEERVEQFIAAHGIEGDPTLVADTSSVFLPEESR